MNPRNQRKKRMSIQFDIQTLKKIEKIAKQENRSFSFIAHNLLKEALLKNVSTKES